MYMLMYIMIIFAVLYNILSPAKKERQQFCLKFQFSHLKGQRLKKQHSFFTLWTTFISALLPTCFGKSGYCPIVTNLIGRLDVLFALLPSFASPFWTLSMGLLLDCQVNLTKVIFNVACICWSFNLVVIFEEFVMLGWHWQVIKCIFEGI